jgi:hypothetical protein
LRALEHELSKESDENYANKMTILKEKEFEVVADSRFKLEVALDEKLINEKDQEIKTLKDGREQVLLNE